MLVTDNLTDGVDLACARLDGLASLAGPELGRWIIEVAGRYAADSCRRRTQGPAGSRQKAVGGKQRGVGGKGRSASVGTSLPTANRQLHAEVRP